LWGAVQYLNGHEVAPAHRHTPGAVRFVLEGDGVWTTVDGDACDMHPGDLVLTPSWTWHDHCNDGDRTMIWFDGLDLPLAIALEAVFFEPYPDLSQHVEGRHNRSERRFGGRAMRPLSDPPTAPHSSLLVYRWADTDAALTALVDEDGGPHVALEFVNPATGTSALPTFACEMHRIVPGARTVTRQRVGGAVYVVYRGTGSTVIAGQRFDWTPGDMFVVPSWAPFDHVADDSADLFAITDRPTLAALNLYRERLWETNQDVTSSFDS
jgi:gentisate 1,2-dioxygenase